MSYRWPSFIDWTKTPTPPYIPAADVQFPQTNPTVPHELPPTSMRFYGAQYNKMNNIPSSVVKISGGPRYGRQF
jgi:hypothetical protein